jgi:endonuclease G
MKTIFYILIPLFLFANINDSILKINNFISNVKCDKVLHKKAFDICYNYKYKHPNYVTYTLSKNLVNKNLYTRKGLRFRPDYQISTKYRSYSKDYSKTGFDRGHNAPNASFDYNRAIQKETFLMSNIAPQKPQLNRRLWAKIEKFTRYEAVKYKQIKIITGVCGSIGHIKNNVNIPKWWYKIIILPNKKIISFLAPNTNSGMSKVKIKKFLSNIDEIKEKCKY